jgi:hypothetical protein
MPAYRNHLVQDVDGIELWRTAGGYTVRHNGFTVLADVTEAAARKAANALWREQRRVAA